ncbi:MAG: site-2 protease family protein [Christensenellaceae bacterium]|nr:site-2 protease family protein [Christensenellaceae bacterium]
MLLSATVLQSIGYVCIAILALLGMVVVHEFGHYLAGRILGFKILEFSIGFGPAIFKHKGKKNGVIFSIRPFPLGGSCRFKDEDADSVDGDSFNSKAPWKRLIVLFAGAFFNFIAALIVITLIFTFYGQVLPRIDKVNYDSSNIGVLQEGDIILSVNGKQLNILMQSDWSNAFGGNDDSANIKVLRDGKTVALSIKKSYCVVGNYDENGVFTPELNENGTTKTAWLFGFSSIMGPQRLGFFRSLGRSFSFMFHMVGTILSVLGSLITGQIGLENAGGPITTISVMSTAAEAGFGVFAYVICLISANLAVMNLLPLPALDGARMVFCTIEWIFKKPIKKSIEGAIHATGFLLLLAFAIFADVFRLLTVGL